MRITMWTMSLLEFNETLVKYVIVSTLNGIVMKAVNGGCWYGISDKRNRVDYNE